jgi:hypothetical protein
MFLLLRFSIVLFAIFYLPQILCCYFPFFYRSFAIFTFLAFLCLVLAIFYFLLVSSFPPFLCLVDQRCSYLRILIEEQKAIAHTNQVCDGNSLRRSRVLKAPAWKED